MFNDAAFSDDVKNGNVAHVRLQKTELNIQDITNTTGTGGEKLLHPDCEQNREPNRVFLD
jgi:hypothetical protein